MGPRDPRPLPVRIVRRVRESSYRDQRLHFRNHRADPVPELDLSLLGIVPGRVRPFEHDFQRHAMPVSAAAARVHLGRPPLLQPDPRKRLGPLVRRLRIAKPQNGRPRRLRIGRPHLRAKRRRIADQRLQVVDRQRKIPCSRRRHSSVLTLKSEISNFRSLSLPPRPAPC
jgi:hypothetical protein